MPKYIRPVEAPITASFTNHVNRTPTSVNPGTDYGCPMNTPVLAPAGGLIVITDPDAGGAGGRMVALDTFDGDGFDFLHLNTIEVLEGEYVSQGQIVAYSGNTGLSSGPHLHLSYRQKHGYHFLNSGNLDFEAWLQSGAAPEPTPITDPEEDDMLYYKDNDTDIIYARDVVASGPELTIIGKNLSNSGIGFLGAPIGAKISPTSGPNIQKLIDWYGVNPVPAGLYAELSKNKPAVKGLSK